MYIKKDKAVDILLFSAGASSEISINVIIKLKEHVLYLSCLFVSPGGLADFFSAWGREKITGLWFARGDQHPGFFVANTLVHN